MADARRVRAERRASCIAQTVPVGRGVHRHSASSADNAAIDPASHEQQDSSMNPLMKLDGRTATASSSLVHRGTLKAQAALLKGSRRGV